jgi:hypothetical protein
MDQFIQERIEYYETMEKAFTREIIADLREIQKNLNPVIKEEAKSINTYEEARLFLKQKKFKGRQLLKGDAILARAILE